jgi:ribosomal-protein-alanine N-acetyltransferase
MQLEDVTAVLAIDALSFPTPMKESLLRYELNENPLAHYQVLAQQLSSGEEQILGFAGYWLLGDEVHVSTIAVHPEQRGKQLGERLLLNLLLLAYTHPARLVTLEVRQSNEAAQQLYAKYWFRVAGKRRRYYKDTGEDAILMTVEPLNGRYHQFLIAQKQTLLPRLETEV